ncbi:glycine cleavage system aminomethyltransferase GcvT [Thermogladius sp. 4427co]|uniref:glycine cleavage system aminomethyltransferase GcvT n=1 Tax=Thermogladius sp. 4427co TaxID=3450718 RepID=UPI003F7920BC
MARIQLLDFYTEKLGAETGFFGEWEVPYRFSSSIEEHLEVRNNVAFFDVSHMGRFRAEGDDVLDFLQYVYTKDLSKTRQGFMSGPTLSLNETARVKDDEMLYKLSENEWLLVVNALMINKMIDYFNTIITNNKWRVKIDNITNEYVMIALQGPKSPDVMESLGAGWALSLKPLEFRTNEKIGDIDVYLVSRSGWTGEDGFEIWAKPSNALKLVNLFVEKKIKPAGLIARDTLRIEAGFVLGGNEYGEDPLKYPCAVGLRYGMGAITWEKKGFVGEQALRACRREGPRWVRYGLKFSKEAGRIVPRHGDPIYVEDIQVGWVTSGEFSPFLERAIAQAYIDTRYAILGEDVEVAIRGRRFTAKIVDFPFIKKK